MSPSVTDETVPYVWGPTFEEMCNPSLIPEGTREAARLARTEDPLDPSTSSTSTGKTTSGT
jgi:hypothetical protein